MGAGVPGTAWGSCRFCGTAVAPGAAICGICGADRPVPPSEFARAPRAVRRRITLLHALYALLVIGIAVALAYTLIGVVLSGPPAVADPLTTSGTYSVHPGWVPILEGNVTGGDYIVGNFTSIQPYDALVELSAYNATEYHDLVLNGSATPSWTTPEEGSGRIVFAAEYTDSYTFVLTNPYAASTNLTITVYVATQYESNVGDDGFG